MVSTPRNRNAALPLATSPLIFKGIYTVAMPMKLAASTLISKGIYTVVGIWEASLSAASTLISKGIYTLYFASC